MSQTGGRANDDTAEQGRAEKGRAAHAGEWFAESTLRIALAVFGFVLLLFALGQAVGMDLLGMVISALNTQMGQWLVVAFFALAIIMIAVRGLGPRSKEPREPEREPEREGDRKR